MRCFIHDTEEAIATCRKCGKAMCSKCSAYSGHSGICPQCRREDFIEERSKLYAIIQLKNKELFWNKVKMVLLCWTLFYPLVRYFTNKTLKNEIQVATVRAESLSKEITKLQTALAKRGTQAFI